MLVRPRILAAASIFPVKSGTPNEFNVKWSKPRKTDRLDHFSVFNTSISTLFQNLSLGDTSQDLSTSYVGEVTHYIVKVAGQMTLVDKGNVQETLKRIRKKLGARTNLQIVSVGIQFYHGMKKDTEGKIKPIKAWNPKTSSGEDTVWFFNPWELVPISEIIKYESVKRGDLILFQKARGLVVKKKFLNKPKFYSTSSWSCYSITLLNFTADGFTRFLPVRSFEVHTSDDPLPPDDQEIPDQDPEE